MRSLTNIMKKIITILASVLILASLTNATAQRPLPTPRSRPTPHERPFQAGAVYVLTNQVQNTVAVFSRAADGTLTSAGEFSTGGAGDPVPQGTDPATDPLVLSDLQRLLGSDLQLRRRHGLIQLRGRYLPYPPSSRTLLRLGPGLLATCLLGLGAARLCRGPAASPAGSVPVNPPLRPRQDSNLHLSV